jgi:pimeloyl-ACP methyl ester carboxylesterase
MVAREEVLDMPARERILNVGDVSLAYESQGDSQREPLLLLHGFLGSRADWGHVFPADDFEALCRNHHVILVDLPGHGASQWGAQGFSHRNCAEVVFALLDHLKIERIKGIGVSAGGNTLLHMAIQQPKRVAAMVITGCPSYFPAQARKLMALVPPEGQGDEDWRIMRTRHKHGDDQIRALWRQARDFKDSHHDMNFTPPLLGTITARTLMVNGDRDPLYPIELFVEMYRAIPEAQLWIVPNGGHAPIFGTERAAFVANARAFLTDPVPIPAAPTDRRA